MRACLVSACLLGASLVACGGPPIPGEDLLLRLEVGAAAVAPGRGFPLTVTRVWNRDLEPSPWEDDALSPLVVRAEKTERREDGRRIEETRSFRAYAFSLDDVIVPRVPFAARPKDGGDLRVVASRPLRLRLTPALDPAAPGPPEPPGPLPRRGSPWLTWLLAISALLVFLAAVRLRAPPLAGRDGMRDARAGARAALDALAARSPASADARRADCLEIAGILRALLAAPARTSEELVATYDNPRLAACLSACDRAQFGAHRPTTRELADAVADACAFVGAWAP